MQGLGANPNGLSFGFGPPEMQHALAPVFLSMKPARTWMTQTDVDWTDIARWDAIQMPDFDVTLKKDSAIKTLCSRRLRVRAPSLMRRNCARPSDLS